jgi:hypothetical protein
MLNKNNFEPDFIKKFNSLNYDTILKDFYSIKKKFQKTMLSCLPFPGI